MANEAVDQEEIGEEAADAPKKSKLKLFIIIGVVALLLVGGGGAAYVFLLPQGGDVTGGESSVAPPPEPEPVVFFTLPEVTVNLANVAGRQQYLKIKATLELRDESEIREIEPYMPRVLDAFQVYLRELRTTDIEGSAGIFRLKEELRKRINVAVYPVEVRKILFEEIIIQ
ncbi:MAG: flagellar basal body-associated FliL family protein [Pseudomonadota bacterium]